MLKIISICAEALHSRTGPMHQIKSTKNTTTKQSPHHTQHISTHQNMILTNPVTILQPENTLTKGCTLLGQAIITHHTYISNCMKQQATKQMPHNSQHNHNKTTWPTADYEFHLWILRTTCNFCPPHQHRYTQYIQITRRRKPFTCGGPREVNDALPWRHGNHRWLLPKLETDNKR